MPVPKAVRAAVDPILNAGIINATSSANAPPPHCKVWIVEPVRTSAVNATNRACVAASVTSNGNSVISNANNAAKHHINNARRDRSG